MHVWIQKPSKFSNLEEMTSTHIHLEANVCVEGLKTYLISSLNKDAVLMFRWQVFSNSFYSWYYSFIIYTLTV